MRICQVFRSENDAFPIYRQLDHVRSPFEYRRMPFSAAVEFHKRKNDRQFPFPDGGILILSIGSLKRCGSRRMRTGIGQMQIRPQRPFQFQHHIERRVSERPVHRAETEFKAPEAHRKRQFVFRQFFRIDGRFQTICQTTD